jgi:hypothetical protein
MRKKTTSWIAVLKYKCTRKDRRLRVPDPGDELGETWGSGLAYGDAQDGRGGKVVGQAECADVCTRQEEKEGKRPDSPTSFVLNWYTPTRTPAVVARRPHVTAGPKRGNLRA